MPSNKSDNQKVRDLVVGATSGIGRSIIPKLLAMGHEVRTVIRKHPGIDSDWKNLPKTTIPYVSDITLENGSDEAVLKEACRGVDNIFHLAGGGYNTNNTFDRLVKVNVEGTENILNAYISVNGPDRPVHFLYGGSNTVYGYKRKGEVLTEESTIKPASPYSESKYMAEQVIKVFNEVNKSVKYTIMRMGTLYGEDYTPSFFKLFRLIEEGKAAYVGNGSNHLTLVHEDDATDAMMLAMLNPSSYNQIYNVTDGVNYTVRQLFELVANTLGVPPPKRHIPYLLAKVTKNAVNINYDELEFLASDRMVSIDKARRDLGYVPKKKIETEGVRLVKLYRESRA
jgi:nucleoside-diphosphate-sugar epimerase